MGVDIEPEKLTVFEVLLVLAVQVGAEEFMWAIVEVLAALRLVVGGVVEILGLVEAKHIVIDGISIGPAVFEGGQVGEIEEGVLGERIAAMVLGMGIGACPVIVLIFLIAWDSFEGGQEELDCFDVSLGVARLHPLVLVFLEVRLVHRAQ